MFKIAANIHDIFNTWQKRQEKVARLKKNF